MCFGNNTFFAARYNEWQARPSTEPSPPGLAEIEWNSEETKKQSDHVQQREN
jgi:hypothetical protein